MRQLTRENALPFWEDLLALATTRGPDRDANERQLESLARRYALPYPAAWVQPLTALLMYPSLQSIVVSLPSDFAFSTARITYLYTVQLRRVATAIKPRDANRTRLWECKFLTPPLGIPQRERLKLATRQMRTAFHQAWLASRAPRYSLEVRVLAWVLPGETDPDLWLRPGFVDPEWEVTLQSLMLHRYALPETTGRLRATLGGVVWDGAYRELDLARYDFPKATEENAARREFVEILLAELPATKLDRAVWWTRGKPPNWRELASIWAARHLKGLTRIRKIAAELDPESRDAELPRRIRYGLRRLRQLAE